MKRDMDLVREILLEIENQDGSIDSNILKFEGYDMKTIAYHCKILYEAELISDYNPLYAGGNLCYFEVGPLTWEGNDYLDKVRDSSIWRKTKDTITKKGLPLVLDTIKTISTAFITAAAEGVANSILKNGGQNNAY